ncbi:unnamed protein product [Amoebophrya sp. A120]|nr:unnamed protein product [Amoebophrya sp. A120]|eukprot:GSA120T00019702001.1
MVVLLSPVLFLQTLRFTRRIAVAAQKDFIERMRE